MLLTTMSTDCSPFFPPELQREIFGTVAYHYPEMIASLVLVPRSTIYRKFYLFAPEYKTS
jgi:hypothetical protein